VTASHDDPEADEAGTEPASKSARKRAAHAAQDLGEELVRLRDPELEALELPEALLEAIRAARRITSRAALARQRQYIGKLMREVDPTPIRAALAARSARTRRETGRFKLIASWRERLIAEGPAALAELSRAYPQIDRDEWTGRVEAARAQHSRPGGGAAAARELFRALRALFDTMPR
jgi:ribosome-associated protein